jgi:hypothetical protein
MYLMSILLSILLVKRLGNYSIYVKLFFIGILLVSYLDLI